MGEPFDIGAACRRAKDAARGLPRLSPADRTRGLHAMADAIAAETKAIAEASAEDVARARKNGVAEPLVDRLALTPARVTAMVEATRAIAAQPDVLGSIEGLERRPNGMQVGQMRVPLGVIAMIYEARPNVTVDAAALGWKSGNAVVLRGGSDAATCNALLGRVVRDSLAGVGFSPESVQVVPPLDREQTKVLLAQTGVVDLVIPRGGEGLIRFVTEHARVPVIQHFLGVCHLYADAGVDPDLVVRLVEDGKARRPGTCNATECLLVHESVAASVLPRVGERLGALGVELRAEPRAKAFLPGAVDAKDDDFGREFLDRILAVKVVSSFDEATAHIARFGSGHTEAIATPSYASAQAFLASIDAACVLVNASTRFHDGGELGLGAEVGISTSKLHAYGAMGAIHLTTRKWIVYGDGQIRG